jgi:hypothetical protein
VCSTILRAHREIVNIKDMHGNRAELRGPPGQEAQRRFVTILSNEPTNFIC